MAGVAGPLLRSNRTAGLRLLLGLLCGELAAGVLLAVPAYLLSRGLHAVLPEPARLWLLAGLCAGFAVADLANRTPHIWRQVPQRLIYRLQPGALGLAWGADLGLLFTTQKAVSMIWVGLVAAVLLDPATAAWLTILVALLAGLGVTAQSIWHRPHRRPVSAWGRRVRVTRAASGAIILALALSAVVQAWNA